MKLYTMYNKVLEKERKKKTKKKHEAQGQRFSVLEWPVNQDIEKLVKACPMCLKNMPSQTSETLLPHGIPSGPMQTLGADLFQFDNADFLIVADYFSEFSIIRRLSNHYTSTALASQM